MPPVSNFWQTSHVIQVFAKIFKNDKLAILTCILRIKTIYISMLEKRGLPFKQTKSLEQLIEDEEQKISAPDSYYSKNYYHFIMNANDLAAIEQTLAKFSREIDTTNLEHLNRVQPTKTAQLRQNVFNVNFIADTIKIKLSDLFAVPPKRVIWQDIRVSKRYLKQVFRGQNYTDPNLLWQKFGQLQMGMFEQLMQNKNITEHLQPRMIAFQCLIPLYVGLCAVMPRRIPLLEDQKVVKFAHYQYLEICCLHTQDRWGQTHRYDHWGPILNRFTTEYLNKHKFNPNTYECFLPNISFIHLPVMQRRQAAFSFSTCFSICTTTEQNINTFKPAELKDLPVLHDLQDQYKLMPKLKELCCRKEFEMIKMNDKFQTADNAIIKSVSDEKGGFQLLRLIKSVPNLKFKLTTEQELMICTPQNILCLGRSGTGKTTSSALRLFATEAYYKYHDLLRKFKLTNPQAKLADFKPPADFIAQSSDVKLLFISASPVLVNEVKRFFIDFKTHFTLELQKVRGTQEKVEAEKQEDQFDNYIAMEIKELEQDENLESQSNLSSSMESLSANDFPLFLTVKRLLYMLDASTDYPFFARDKNGNQIGMDTNVQWHNEAGGVLMINQYFKANNDIDQQIKQLGLKLLDYTAQVEVGVVDEHNEAAQTSKKQPVYMGLGSLIDTDQCFANKNYSRQGQNLSFEVDFEIFKNRFWPKVNCKLSPLVVWTEICSEIKGRHDSWQYYLGLPDTMYIRFNRQKNHFLTPEERFKIYEIFLQYERWKQQLCSYDLNDLVNHILRQVKGSMLKEHQMVHFLMVDEVQDLTQNIITLFMMLAEKNVFFSGDTAQTIAKGVGFRFFDLKSVFTKQNYESQQVFQVPKVLQLAKNFRSHSKILDLANSVVSLLELLFPKTIDKLVKETSDTDGPRPIMIDQVDRPTLFKLLEKYLLFGSVPTAGSKQGQFGCTQVIIVRDQESKQEVPEFMRDMLCLTVYEAKGLEFDDVILFNFFKDSKCESQWRLLNDVVVSQTKVKIEDKSEFLDFDHLECEEPQVESDQTENLAVDGETQTRTILKLRNHHDLVYRKFALVCTELKLLYVAITRPKNFLIIFDDDATARKPIQEYLRATNAVDFIDKTMANNQELLPVNLQQVLRQKDTPVLNEQYGKYQSDVVKQTWQLQGLKLFKVRFYRAAAQCFQNMGDLKLVKRCQAYESADLAAQIKGQHDQKLALSKDKRNQYTKPERIQLKQEAIILLQQFRDEMMKAGKLFCEIDLNQHAAQCFFSSGNLQASAELFLKQQKIGPAAECYYKLKEYRKAAKLYEQTNLLYNAFECYERLEDWDSLINAISKHKDKFSQKDLDQLVDKYLPIALSAGYSMYAGTDEDGLMGDEQKAKIQQMRLKIKFQKSVSVIQEDNADEVSSQSSEESQEMPTLIEDPSLPQLLDVNDSKQVEPEVSDSLVIISDDQDQSSSIVIIDDQLPIDQDLRQLELELLSSIDPDDQFLKSEKSYSLIESVSLNNSSFSVLQSQNSDYSIISGTSLHSALSQMQFLEISSISKIDLSNYSLIVPQQQSSTDEMAIQKLVYYISLFNPSLKQSLERMRSHDPFMSTTGDDDLDFMLIELDQLTSEQIQIVTSTLEQLRMFKLCVLVTQRFNRRASCKFIANILQNYSNLNTFRLICHEKFRQQKHKEQQLKFSKIANEAVQNVLQFTGITDVTESFDAIFLQGFYKKIMFLMDADSIIQLCWAMGEQQHMQMVFMVLKCGSTDLSQFQKTLNKYDGPCSVIELLHSSSKFSDLHSHRERRSLDKALQSLFKPCIKTRRQLFKSYDVSLLDGLPLFSSFQEYCIVPVTSVLFKEIMVYQEQALLLIKLSLLKTQSGTDVQQMAAAKRYVQDAFKSLTFKEQLDHQIALVCDIALDHWLVPKHWVTELIAKDLIQKTIQSEHPVTLQIAISCLNKVGIDYYYNQQMFVINGMKQQTTLYNLCFNQTPRLNQVKQTTQLTTEMLLRQQQCFYNKSKMSIAVQIKPVLPKPVSFKDYKLTQAMILYQSKPRQDKLADHQYNLIKTFPDLIFLQELTNPRLKHMQYLLNAQWYIQALDLPESTSQLCNFLKENYSCLSFHYFKEIVVQIFNHAWFSFNIYQNDCYLTDHSAGLSVNEGQKQVLQDCRVMPATLKHVRNALIWVECYLMNLVQYEGKNMYLQDFDVGLRIVQACMLGDFGKIWDKVKQVIIAVFKGIDITKENEAYYELTRHDPASKPFKDAAKKVKQSPQLILFTLADRKTVAARINQIQLDCTNSYQDIIKHNEERLNQRKAAAKVLKRIKFVNKPVVKIEPQWQVIQFICSNIPQQKCDAIKDTEINHEAVQEDTKRLLQKEKWDHVIQFHKKKRTMLRHFRK